MIEESYARAAEDIAERQVRESRIEADQILAAVEKGRASAAYLEMTPGEQVAIERAINELLAVYHSDNHELVRAHIENLNQATMRLAEVMMNAAVRTALQGKKI
jgi:molecular chaperone DnaK (HSP70)